MTTRTRSSIKVKQENEIQSYINSFKEIEEQEEEATTSGGSKKGFVTEQLDSEEYEEVLVSEEYKEEQNEEDFKYVFIVQDEEDAGEDTKGNDDAEVYEFDEIEEDALDEVDDKVAKVMHVIKKPATSAPQGNSHVCSYCSYTTPKRYLLARHMKSHSEDRLVNFN